MRKFINNIILTSTDTFRPDEWNYLRYEIKKFQVEGILGYL